MASHHRCRQIKRTGPFFGWRRSLSNEKLCSAIRRMCGGPSQV
jgi:hypothetical protein